MGISLKDKILETLRTHKGFDESKFNAALKIQKEKGGSLGKILIDTGALSQKDYMLILSRQLNIPPINLSRYKLDPALMKSFPEDIIRIHKVIPISKMGDTLTVAIVDPFDIFVMDKLKGIINYRVDIVLTTEEDAKGALENFYTGRGLDIKQAIEQFGGDEVGIVEETTEEKEDASILADKVNLAPIIKMVNLILIEAHNKRASDIHIEPAEKSLKIRYRIDGVLHEILNLPKTSQNAIIARVKIMAKLDITQSYLPQDGRFKIRVEDKEIDFRVSVLPTAFGNKVVLRLLDKTTLGTGLDNLGFTAGSLSLFKQAVDKPYGMILVTGPTGSGKSTSLYCILKQLNTAERSIITLEDPVEYQIEGITQIQAKAEIGLTFASGLRSLLRQNPDVIMVGEIRDSETADIAIKASLTGQLVFSTLHTNDTTSAITRLVDMGVEPFLISSSIVFICAQRLCRKICSYCKELDEIPKSVFERMNLNYDSIRNKSGGKFYIGKGCAKCGNTGFLGRTGIIEAFMINEDIKNLICRRASSAQIKTYAVKEGMKTLREDAIDKFTGGITTLEEALSVTSEE